MDDTARLAEFLDGARRLLVFTGAGVSTGSGIPDFRGPDGVWKRRSPVYFQDFMRDEAARVEHWEFKLEGWDGFKAARPNAAHRALVALEKTGRLLRVVTQNIDGLHQKAGHGPGMVVELHGTNLEVECVSCGARSDPEPAFALFARERRCPTCACGGYLKTATVSFGQSMPREPLARAYADARECDAVLAIGSTLEVQPAASVPLLARERRVPYAILNQGPTAQDAVATLRLEGDACSLLPAALEMP